MSVYVYWVFQYPMEPVLVMLPGIRRDTCAFAVQMTILVYNYWYEMSLMGAWKKDLDSEHSKSCKSTTNSLTTRWILFLGHFIRPQLTREMVALQLCICSMFKEKWQHMQMTTHESDSTAMHSAISNVSAVRGFLSKPIPTNIYNGSEPYHMGVDQTRKLQALCFFENIQLEFLALNLLLYDKTMNCSFKSRELPTNCFLGGFKQNIFIAGIVAQHIKQRVLLFSIFHTCMLYLENCQFSSLFNLIFHALQPLKTAWGPFFTKPYSAT